MMYCKYGRAEDYIGCTFEELLVLRSKVMEDIVAFEEDRISDKSRVIKPGAEYEYRLNLEFLSELLAFISNRFREEHSDLLRAIGTGEFKVSGDEGTVAQVKRHTRLRNETRLCDGDSEVEFSINDKGSIEAFIDGELAGTVENVDATGSFEFGNEILGGAYLLLEAECHNRRFIGAGGLKRIAWEVFSDGSYKVKRNYNLSWNELEKASDEEAETGREIVSTDVLDDDQFKRLQNAINREIWRTDDEPYVTKRESSEWVIVQYDSNGHVLNSSGEPGSIDGAKNLEAIVNCLPSNMTEWERKKHLRK